MKTEILNIETFLTYGVYEYTAEGDYGRYRK